MGRIRKPREHTECVQCGSEIPKGLRSDAAYCNQTCRAAAEKARYCARNPEYVKKQRRLVSEIYHRNLYGHTDFLDMKVLNPKDKYAKARALGYRSGLEVAVANQLRGLGHNPEDMYEKFKVKYRVDETRRYTPDIVLPNGIIVESKGRFTATDRKKHLLVKAQHPELDIRFVFSNSRAKLNKGSKTTYSDWCLKHGYKFSDKLIPEEWLDEV